MDSIDAQIANLKKAIDALDSQRAALGEAVVQDSIAALKRQLAELQEQPKSSEQQRKLATLLFVDTVGSTRIAGELDPEVVMDIMIAALNRLAAPIEEHGGRVVSYQGDGFLAVFGLPTAHENDPEQAIRASLAIQELAREIAKDLQAQWGVSEFQVRIGINTGLVAAGGLTEAQDTIIGKPVNLASRLEHAAPLGGILISHGTYRHVPGIFDLKPLEPIQVEGFDSPIQVYLVTGVKAFAFHSPARGVEGMVTGMIGRQYELKQLQDSLHTAIIDREGQVVTILGEAGVGKSRLAQEFQSWLELFPEPVSLFLGRARQETAGTPYALLRGMFTNNFQIMEDDSPSVACEKFERGIRNSYNPPSTMGAVHGTRAAHIIGQLLGFDFSSSPHLKNYFVDPQALRNQAFAYLGEYFKALGELHAVVIILDDIHWADDSSLDAINALGRKTPQMPLIIVTLARARLIERRPYWGEGQTYHRILNLPPLSKHESRQLVEAILHKVEQIPAALRELIISSTEGNPFYIEETVKMLIDEDVIVIGEERWSIEPMRLVEVKVPSTLVGVLQARLDSLPLEERTVLQQAAIVGRVFWDQVLRYMHATTGERQGGTENWQEIKAALSALRSKEMIFQREESAFAQTQEYIFKHEVLRDVAYEMVLLKLRRQYHAVVADWLVEQAKGGTEDLTGMIANHLELSGRGGEACTYLLRAGEKALAGFANAEAERYFRRALKLDAEPIERAHILEGLAQAQALQGNRTEAMKSWQTGIESFQELDDFKGVARLYAAATKVFLPHFPVEALEIGETGLAAVGDMEESTENAQLMHQVARALTFKGEGEEAEKLCRQALSIAKRNGDIELQADALSTLGVLLFTYPEQAVATLKRAIQLAEASGSFYLIYRAHTNMANAYSRLFANHSAAREHISTAVEVSSQRGALQDLVFSRGNLIEIYSFLGEISAAENTIHEIELLVEEAPEPDVIVHKLYWERVLLARLRGQWQAVIEHFQEILAESRRMGRVERIYLLVVNNLFPTWMDYDRYVEKISWTSPEEIIREVIGLTKQAIWLGESEVKCLLCTVFARQGRFEEARKLLAELKLERPEHPSAYLDQFLAIADAELSIGEARWEDSIQALESLLEETKRAGQRWDQARALLTMGDVYTERSTPGDMKRAHDCYNEALELFEKMGAMGYVEVAKERFLAFGERTENTHGR